MTARPVEKMPPLTAMGFTSYADLPGDDERFARLTESSGWLRGRLGGPNDDDEAVHRVLAAVTVSVLFDPRVNLTSQQRVDALALIGPYTESAAAHIEAVARPDV